MAQEHDWQTLAAHYRYRLLWALVLFQMTAVYLFVVPNENIVKWAKYKMGSWYYYDLIWLLIGLICFGAILLISKALEKLIFINLEQ